MGLSLGGSSNGRTSGFGPENRGSNPCPPVRRRAPRLAPGVCPPANGHAQPRMPESTRVNGRGGEGSPGNGSRGGVGGVNSIPPVAAPTVLILAAGQGTRMRSKMPKVMHQLCGLPMVLWPVRAALEAGAGWGVVVDTHERALAQLLPPRGELAVQE